MSSTGPAPTTPAAPAAQLPPPVATGPAVGTIVWGVVVLLLGVLLGAREVADVRVDVSLVLPVGMVVTGVLLLVGAVVTNLRRDRRGHV